MITTERLIAQSASADDLAVQRAVELLANGKLVALPTETVYGLAGLATNERTVAQIFAAKKRPSFNPLISHYDRPDALLADVIVPPLAEKLIEDLMPGPLTLVLAVTNNSRISALARAGNPTAAVRVPAHPLARQVLRDLGQPVAAPSANLSGRLTPTSAEAVLDQLDGAIHAVLDGGTCEVGVESTILSVVDGQPVLLRPGGIPTEHIEELLGLKLRGPDIIDPDKPTAPGQLLSHYAPGAPVQLNAKTAAPSAAILDFGGALQSHRDAALAYRDLSPVGDLTEAAANLFAFLWALDRAEPSRIYAAPIPTSGLGEAINDRLTRAAAPR